MKRHHDSSDEEEKHSTKRVKKSESDSGPEDFGKYLCAVRQDAIAKARQLELKQRNEAHRRSCTKAQLKNQQEKRVGQVRCAKQVHFRAPKGVDKSFPLTPGFTNVSVCSGSRTGKVVSPMVLGPIDYEDDHTNGIVSVTNLENLWQFSKVWEGEDDPVTGEPLPVFFERRAQGFANVKGVRHVKKGNGPNPNVPLYSYWKGKHLSYLEGRREIYCPLYAELASQTVFFHQLRQRLNQGENLQIIGYDGYDIGDRSLRDCFLDTSRPFGHELVLVCLLRGEAPWKE